MKIARGIAALVILLGLLVGIPAGLIAFGGNPLPTEWSAQAFGQALLRPASDRALIGIVTIIGWIAWAGFAVSVVAELLNALSGRRIVAGRRIHLQLPVIGVGQKFAAMLIVAVITMIAVPHAQPTAEAAPREPTPTAAATATPHIAPDPTRHNEVRRAQDNRTESHRPGSNPRARTYGHRTQSINGREASGSCCRAGRLAVDPRRPVPRRRGPLARHRERQPRHRPQSARHRTETHHPGAGPPPHGCRPRAGSQRTRTPSRTPRRETPSPCNRGTRCRRSPPTCTAPRSTGRRSTARTGTRSPTPT